MKLVAALYVDVERGPYPRLEGVVCYGARTKEGFSGLEGEADAKTYAGPHPVIAHPPCGPWGRFRWRYRGGEGDALCGVLAVHAVQRFGGVLEHPANSFLWPTLGLPAPGEVDSQGGVTLVVNQTDFGHRALKPTWLYCVGVRHTPPWPKPGTPSAVVVRRVDNRDELPELPKRERHLTPEPFARWLVDAARSVEVRS